MKGLYLLLDIGTIFFPLVLSFDRRVHYVSKWKTVLLSTFIIAIPFLIWDAIFTHHGIWGFNHDYLIGFDVYNLPLEEVLFFLVVPFACTFIYECCSHYFRKINFDVLNKLLLVLIPAYAVVLTLLDSVGWYTFVVIISSTLVLIWWMFNIKLPMVGISFIISLIPFLGVNGVLTGIATEKPVVWYNEAHKVAPRIWTIPMEDVSYCFTLVVSVILLHEYLQRKALK